MKFLEEIITVIPSHDAYRIERSAPIFLGCRVPSCYLAVMGEQRQANRQKSATMPLLLRAFVVAGSH
jgi:hypothetical protein